MRFMNWFVVILLPLFMVLYGGYHAYYHQNWVGGLIASTFGIPLMIAAQITIQFALIVAFVFFVGIVLWLLVFPLRLLEYFIQPIERAFPFLADSTVQALVDSSDEEFVKRRDLDKNSDGGDSDEIIRAMHRRKRLGKWVPLDPLPELSIEMMTYYDMAELSEKDWQALISDPKNTANEAVNKTIETAKTLREKLASKDNDSPRKVKWRARQAAMAEFENNPTPALAVTSPAPAPNDETYSLRAEIEALRSQVAAKQQQ